MHIHSREDKFKKDNSHEKIGDADGSRTSKIRLKGQRLNQLRQPGIADFPRFSKYIFS